MKEEKHYKVVVIGAGTAGVSFSAHLLRMDPSLKGYVAIIDPSNEHYFQPLWSLVGGGMLKKEVTLRKQEDLIPGGVEWIRQSVVELLPEDNKILLEDACVVEYNVLIVAAGIQINWKHIKGLQEAIGSGGVCSNYSYQHVDYTWDQIKNFKGGTAIFTHPNTPIKCGGASQKIVYLAEEYFHKKGIRNDSTVIFNTANERIFHVPRYESTLKEVLLRKNIQPNYQQNLIEIKPKQKEVVFEHVVTYERHTISYDLLHVVPSMGAPTFIKNSSLGDEQGWVDVHPLTLQHVRYQHVFALGDCANLPTSKTGAAIRKQIPVLTENVLAFIRGQALQATYDGYTCCPIVTGYKSLVLAEFDYQYEPQETFPFDQSKERYSMFLLKRYGIPYMYWNRMVKGVM